MILSRTYGSSGAASTATFAWLELHASHTECIHRSIASSRRLPASAPITSATVTSPRRVGRSNAGHVFLRLAICM